MIQTTVDEPQRWQAFIVENVKKLGIPDSSHELIDQAVKWFTYISTAASSTGINENDFDTAVGELNPHLLKVTCSSECQAEENPTPSGAAPVLNAELTENEQESISSSWGTMPPRATC